MNKLIHPLETIIDFAFTTGADAFWVNNAKDELKRLRTKIQEIDDMLANPVAWARINDRGDLYDLRIQNNPYVDHKIIVPLYRLK